MCVCDEADETLARQILALKRNGISLIELRSVDGKNVSELTDEEAVKVVRLILAVYKSKGKQMPTYS